MEQRSSSTNSDGLNDDAIEVEDFWENLRRQIDDSFLTSMQQVGISFTSYLHSLPNYNRAMVFDMISSLKKMVLEPLMSIVCEAIKPAIPEGENATVLNNIMKATQAFDLVDTEHKFVKLLKERGSFKMPLLDQVSNELLPMETDDGVEVVEKTKSNVYIGLENFFINFFGIEANMTALLNSYGEIFSSAEGVYDNFVKGKFWKQKIEKRQNEICIPYFIFADSFEINNPLGSKAGKQALTGFYLNFPSLPRHIHGKTENMFLLQFVYSAVEKSLSNEEVLHTLIEEIIHLEKNPLQIRVQGEVRSIYFLFGGLRGDNLGLNSILDYSKSFVANHPCRICSMDLDNIRKCTVDNAALYRTEESYNMALENGRFSETGIRKNSVFNTIPNFHVTDLKIVDCMHDFYEGFAHDALASCISDFITNGYFSLHILNQRVQRFDFDINQRKVIPPEIKQEHLESCKFKMSASQMKCLVDNITLMLGDLVPATEEWRFLVNVTRIGTTIMKPSFTSVEIQELKDLINTTLTQYQTLFKKHLKPKAHFLTHYPLAIEWTGPTRFTSTFIPEMKHKYFKKIATTTSSEKTLL
nr:uncharacterized protein LOC115268372 [Aedes albopictus]